MVAEKNQNLEDSMIVLALLGLAHADETDCVTKDNAWRWLSTTQASADGTPAGDLWVHDAKVVAKQAPGSSGRLAWTPDESAKVVFQTKTSPEGAQIETFKWDVALKATDGKPISADVTDTELKLSMVCQRTGGAVATGSTLSAAKPAPATPAPAKAAETKPAVTAAPATPAAAPAKEAPKAEAPKADAPKTDGADKK